MSDTAPNGPVHITDYRVTHGLMGKEHVVYECPACHEALKSLIEEAGRGDQCPVCMLAFVVPGKQERQRREEEKRERAQKRTVAQEEERQREQSIQAAIIAAESREAHEQRMRSASPDYPIAQFVAGVCYILAIIALIAGAIAIANRVEKSGEWDWIATIMLLSAGSSAIAYAFMGELISMIRDMAINSWHSRRHLEQMAKRPKGESDAQE